MNVAGCFFLCVGLVELVELVELGSGQGSMCPYRIKMQQHGGCGNAVCLWFASGILLPNMKQTLTCRMRLNVIPALQTPMAAKPPIMRGRRPSFSMVKHCRRTLEHQEETQRRERNTRQQGWMTFSQ